MGLANSVVQAGGSLAGAASALPPCPPRLAPLVSTGASKMARARGTRTAWRRAARPEPRSRCQEAGSGGAVFQMPESAANAPAAGVRTNNKSLRNRIDPPGASLLIQVYSL